jgi:hypothetical protein
MRLDQPDDVLTPEDERTVALRDIRELAMGALTDLRTTPESMDREAALSYLHAILTRQARALTEIGKRADTVLAEEW